MSKHFARKLRSRMTDAELRIWIHLRAMRQHGIAFRRQSPIGPFVVDFECRRALLIVEVDGSQHELPDARDYDQRRSEWLENRGYWVMRCSNHEALHTTEETVALILRAAKARVALRYPD